MLHSTPSAQLAAATSSLFEIVVTALEAKDRLLPDGPLFDSKIDWCKEIDFYLEERSSGWVWGFTFHAYEEFQDSELPLFTMPEATPQTTKRDAFLAGASDLCWALTGSEELPFVATDTTLLIAGYGTGGIAGIFSMTRPGPWL